VQLYGFNTNVSIAPRVVVQESIHKLFGCKSSPIMLLPSMGQSTPTDDHERSRAKREACVTLGSLNICRWGCSILRIICPLCVEIRDGSLTWGSRVRVRVQSRRGAEGRGAQAVDCAGTSHAALQSHPSPARAPHLDPFPPHATPRTHTSFACASISCEADPRLRGAPRPILY